MTKDNSFDIYTNLYDIWIKQSKEFFETANDHLQDFFSKNNMLSPENHIDQIKTWLNHLKNQWEQAPFTSKQESYQQYLTMMNKIFNEASELMIKKWIKRVEEKEPIKNSLELYELWLDCCYEAYQKSMFIKAHQELYGNMMDAAIKFWKENIPKC
jgi:hypothetical protein